MIYGSNLFDLLSILHLGIWGDRAQDKFGMFLVSMIRLTFEHTRIYYVPDGSNDLCGKLLQKALLVTFLVT